MRGLARPPFVGRADELALLLEGLVAATGSRPSCVAVTGDAGVGKTRLLAEFAQRARQEGARVIAGAGIDLAAGEFPFGVFLSALRDLARSGRGGESSPAQPPSYDEVMDLLRADPGEAAAGRSGRTQLFDKVLDLIGELSDEQPLVLVLEDLHWADRSSLDLLLFRVQDLCQERDLLRDLPRERILIVLSWRTDEAVDGSARADALADLERLQCVEPLRLRSLPRDDLSTILRAVAPAAIPA
jgi:predicted ATPase